MRDVKKLDNFYLTLKNIHQEDFPDWRFGQFIHNFITWCGGEIFYLEEYEFLAKLHAYVRETKSVCGKREEAAEKDYKQGLSDMMECQQKISKMSEDDLYKYFDLDDEDDPDDMWKLKLDVILKKVKNWEKEKERSSYRR